MHLYLLYHGVRTKVLRTLSRHTMECKMGLNFRVVIYEKKSVLFRINEIYIIIIHPVRSLEVFVGSPLSTSTLYQ